MAGRSNQGKPILHTIDPEFILGIGKVSEFGNRKYHYRNFLITPGMKWSDVYESLLRHLLAFWAGDETDEESGLHHLLHAAWNLMVLYSYSVRSEYSTGDNRPSMVEWDGRLWEDWRKEFEESQYRMGQK